VTEHCVCSHSEATVLVCGATRLLLFCMYSHYHFEGRSYHWVSKIYAYVHSNMAFANVHCVNGASHWKRCSIEIKWCLTYLMAEFVVWWYSKISQLMLICVVMTQHAVRTVQCPIRAIC